MSSRLRTHKTVYSIAKILSTVPNHFLHGEVLISPPERETPQSAMATKYFICRSSIGEPLPFLFFSFSPTSINTLDKKLFFAHFVPPTINFGQFFIHLPTHLFINVFVGFLYAYLIPFAFICFRPIFGYTLIH